MYPVYILFVGDRLDTGPTVLVLHIPGKLLERINFFSCTISESEIFPQFSVKQMIVLQIANQLS